MSVGHRHNHPIDLDEAINATQQIIKEHRRLEKDNKRLRELLRAANMKQMRANDELKSYSQVLQILLPYKYVGNQVHLKSGEKFENIRKFADWFMANHK